MLCDRFIRKFGHLGPGGAPAEIMLNNVAAQLGVPRRRLYDIINVMEAVEVRTLDPVKRITKLVGSAESSIDMKISVSSCRLWTDFGGGTTNTCIPLALSFKLCNALL